MTAAGPASRPHVTMVSTALLVILVVLTLGGCAARPSGIADLARYPQDAAAYLPPGSEASPLVPPEVQARLDNTYDTRFFAPWQQQRASLPAAEAFWGVAAYADRQGFGENLLPIAPRDWQQLVASLQRDSYPSLARPAITVRNTACRVFPTFRPFFLDPQQAGEGYPFDYFQNSALWSGTPLLITHVSADGAWFFAEAGFVAGWVPATDVAWADATFRAAYQTGRYAALIRDEVTLRDVAGEFLALTHIGALFPLAAQDGEGLQLLVPVRDADGVAVARSAFVDPAHAAPKPLPLQAEQIAVMANRMLGQTYGWGGLYENRDCSSTLRDLFTPFGVWLPRNSGDQAGSGTLDDLAALDESAKRARILQHGVPFYTLLWFRGHIGLYLGPDPVSGEPMLLHNLWGVRTTGWLGREGRAVVGRLVITSLHPGEERPDVEDGRFLRRVLGMTVLPGRATR